MLDAGNPHGIREYFKVDWLSELPDEAIDLIVEQAEKLPAPFGQLILGAAWAARSAARTRATMALNMPDAPWAYFCLSMWMDPAEDDAEPRLGARLRRGDAARSGSARRYPNFIEPDEGNGAAAGVIRPGEVRAPGRAEAQVGPGQPLPAEPEHRAGRLRGGRRR